MLSKRTGLWASAFCIALCYCATRDEKPPKPPSLFAEYVIQGEEGAEMVTGFLQFRSDENGRGEILQEPAKVELDGEELQWDTVALNGAFYEFQMPLAEFVGNHTLIFTDESSHNYIEQFNYQPFALKNELGDRVSREKLMLSITGLHPEDSIKVILSDTAFYTEGINEWAKHSDGQLDIRNKLANVSNGPVVLQLYKESDKLIKHGMTTIGKISISYGLKREFELID